jgi:branched-chain amino acid transport system permease protein
MTVLENVVAPLRSFSWRRLGADAVSGPEAERAYELLEFVGMHRFATHQAGTLSYGQGKLVELAQILMLDPKLIMLDEPAGGINPTLIAHIEEMIRELNRQGTTFLIVEHNMPLVLGLCDPVCVLARGRTICEGTPDRVQADPAVLDAYLGQDFTLEERAEVTT